MELNERLIVVDEDTVHCIKQALHELKKLDLVQQRRVQDELNRRAINLVCQGLIDCGISDAGFCSNIQDPLHYKFIILQDDKPMVHDVYGHTWLLIGI